MGLEFQKRHRQLVRRVVSNFPGPARWSDDESLFFAAVHPDDLARVRTTVERATQTGEAFAYDHRIVVEPSETRTLHVVARAILDDKGTPIGLSGSAQDTTEQNTLSEQLRQSQKMEAVGRLAGGVAHDFNNILTVIKSYAGFLIETLPENSRARSDAVEIGIATDRAAHLTKQLGVFGRREMVKLQVVDLNATVASMKDMIERLVGENVTVEVLLEPSLWAVRADSRQLEQVLMNLVVNARDALADGGLIRIETANVSLPATSGSAGEDFAGGRFAVMSVCDDGAGMTQATKMRIFEPFFTTKESGKGTGLGLSMVYAIVKQCGGRIAVEAKPDRVQQSSFFSPRRMKRRPSSEQPQPSQAFAEAPKPFSSPRMKAR